MVPGPFVVVSLFSSSNHSWISVTGRTQGPWQVKRGSATNDRGFLGSIPAYPCSSFPMESDVLRSLNNRSTLRIIESLHQSNINEINEISIQNPLGQRHYCVRRPHSWRLHGPPHLLKINSAVPWSTFRTPADDMLPKTPINCTAWLAESGYCLWSLVDGARS